MMSATCALARHLGQRIQGTPALELMAPVALNIVCFRYRCEDADRVNAQIAIALQEAGVVAPSTTSINGCLAIRAAVFNHRTEVRDVDHLLDATLTLGMRYTQPSAIDS